MTYEVIGGYRRGRAVDLEQYPKYGYDASITVGVGFSGRLDEWGRMMQEQNGIKLYELPDGLYSGLVGTVSAEQHWTAGHLDAFRNNEGLCLVEFPNRGRYHIPKRYLRFALPKRRSWVFN